MLRETLIKIFNRDLGKLKAEIENYSSDDKIWLTAGTIKNSAGNIAQHLIGNLNYYIGNVLGNSGYLREREKEFTLRDIPREKIITEIENLTKTVDDVLDSLDETEFEKKYPVNVFNEPMSVGFFLVHLTDHLNYHLGQINYHRRLLDIKN